MVISVDRRVAHGRNRLHGLLSRAVDAPVVAVFLVALIVRVVAAIAVNLLVDGVLIPDETTYLRIVDLKSTGDLSVEPTLRCLEYANADGTSLWCSYWRGLFDSTRTFSWPLTGLFWMFGPHRILGQLLAGFFGALAAAATSRLALVFLRKPFALVAGLGVALLPSQVLFSSVVLRESAIWLCLACIGVLLGRSSRLTGSGAVTLAAAGLALIFVLLAWLRVQTAVLSLWSAVPIFALAGRHRRVRVLCATGVLVIMPMLVGLGPAAEGFVSNSLVRLGYTRNVMSLGAETAFDYTAVVEVPSVVEVPRQTGALAIITRDAENESLSDTLIVLPSGLYNTMIRPFLWKPSDIRNASASHVLAGFETPLWLTTYLLAAVGVVMFRHRVSVVGFPFLFLLAIAFSGAASQGNLGTAFRHRGQVVFALAVLGAAGLEAVVDRRHMRRSKGAGGYYLDGPDERGDQDPKRASGDQ